MARRGRGVLDLVDRPLSHPGLCAEIGLTPAQCRPARAKLRGEQLPRVLIVMRPGICFRLFVRHVCLLNKKPPAEQPPGVIDFMPRSGDQGRKSR
jgi:hypothetical protein